MSGAVGRGTRGRAIGGLAGHYPEPAIGLPPAAGLALWEDFLGPGTSAAVRGNLGWAAVTLAGTFTAGVGAPAAATECGVATLTTGATSGHGGLFRFGASASAARAFLTYPPVGSVWAVKLRMTTGTTSYELWSGFAENDADVVSADNDFLGVRSVGGNLFGVARNGTAESTVDLGVDCESAYVSCGLEVTATGVQFFTLSLSNRSLWVRADVGAELTTNLPDESLFPCAAGLLTRTASARVAAVDWWSLGGRVAR